MSDRRSLCLPTAQRSSTISRKVETRNPKRLEKSTVGGQKGQHQDRLLPPALAGTACLRGAPTRLKRPPQAQIERHQAEHAAYAEGDEPRTGGVRVSQVQLIRP